MNRRAFLASLCAPFVARFAPRPAWVGVDWSTTPYFSVVTFSRDGEFLDYRAFMTAEMARIFAIPPSLLQSESPGADVWRRANPNLPWLLPINRQST